MQGIESLKEQLYFLTPMRSYAEMRGVGVVRVIDLKELIEFGKVVI